MLYTSHIAVMDHLSLKSDPEVCAFCFLVQCHVPILPRGSGSLLSLEVMSSRVDNTDKAAHKKRVEGTKWNVPVTWHKCQTMTLVIWLMTCSWPAFTYVILDRSPQNGCHKDYILTRKWSNFKNFFLFVKGRRRDTNKKTFYPYLFAFLSGSFINFL